MVKEELWQGIYKVTEEAGELITLLGKLGPFPGGAHPDNKGNLVFRVQDEVADLYAALDYFAHRNGLNDDYIKKRREEKFEKFYEWGLTGIPVIENDED